MVHKIRNNAHDSTIIEIVDRLLHAALETHASDIHLEPMQEGLRIRLRIDGHLSDQPMVAQHLMNQIVSRLKVLAQMNIAEKRIPQDGKLSVMHNDQLIDLRISTFPVLFGEKMVIRILDRSTLSRSLEELGFSSSMYHDFVNLIQKRQGFFLVTGPTGSGKTTTLYAALMKLHTAEKNIVTLEDPIEYNIAGVTQGHINIDAGFTFERGIRAMLRQDPDVLLVGEIRDCQTAGIAIEASLTGHLVLSTLHTNDAPSAVIRLMDMGIEPFLINASLTGVLAQRLARVICDQCKTEYIPSTQEKELCDRLHISPEKLYKGIGCHACQGRGYNGRIGIFELLVITPTMHTLLTKNPDYTALYQQACNDGMKTLLQDGAEKVQNGLITLEELMGILL